MKKLFTLVLVAAMALVAGNANASSTFAKKDLLGSVTLGFGQGFGQRISVDYGVVDGWLDNKASLGVGASLNNTIGWHGGDWMSLIANCSFHYEFVDKLDSYVVVGFGGGTNFHGGYFDWTSAIGTRYYFKSNLAVNGELGHTNGCYFNVGLTYKF